MHVLYILWNQCNMTLFVSHGCPVLGHLGGGGAKTGKLWKIILMFLKWKNFWIFVIFFPVSYYSSLGIYVWQLRRDDYWCLVLPLFYLPANTQILKSTFFGGPSWCCTCTCSSEKFEIDHWSITFIHIDCKWQQPGKVLWCECKYTALLHTVHVCCIHE